MDDRDYTVAIESVKADYAPLKAVAASGPWITLDDRRLHGSLGHVPPVEYEQTHYAALNPEAQPV